MEIVINLLRGVAIGLANIIPGVSGGTMALVLGIYSRLIQAISNLGPETVKCLAKGPKGILEEMKRIDAIFLGSLEAGALIAIVSVAKLLTWLLVNQHDPTYGFFFGLGAPLTLAAGAAGCRDSTLVDHLVGEEGDGAVALKVDRPEPPPVGVATSRAVKRL